MLQQPDSPVASAWQEKAVTVGYTLLVVFAVKGLTSLWSSTTMTTKGKTDEPSSGVPEAPANKTDKTMIVDSPKKKDDVRPKTVGGDGDSTTTPQTTTPQKPDSQAKGEAPSKEVKTPDANTPSADPASTTLPATPTQPKALGPQPAPQAAAGRGRAGSPAGPKASKRQRLLLSLPSSSRKSRRYKGK